MKKQMKVATFLSASMMFIFLSGCGKWRDNRNTTIIKDQNIIEGLFDDMFKIVDQASNSTAGIKTLDDPCIDAITVDTSSSPKVMVIDYGTDDCASNDGRVRKGILTITYTGRYRTPGTIITVSPENFSIDGYAINGSKTIVNEGLNTLGQPYFSVTVSASITAPNNEWAATWNGNRTRTWTEGYNTILNVFDDVYEITGGGTGINRNNVAYTMTIDEPIVAKVGCSWIVQGIMTIDPEEGQNRVIDWGSGECNNGLTVTVGNNDYEVNGGN
jgi:hypothetical protein